MFGEVEIFLENFFDIVQGGGYCPCFKRMVKGKVKGQYWTSVNVVLVGISRRKD